MSTSFESTNYLDDSDFLSSDDATGYYSSEEENNTPLIESIIKDSIKDLDIGLEKCIDICMLPFCNKE